MDGPAGGCRILEGGGLRNPGWTIVVAIYSAASRGDRWPGRLARWRRPCDWRLVRQRARLLARPLFPAWGGDCIRHRVAAAGAARADSAFAHRGTGVGDVWSQTCAAPRAIVATPGRCFAKSLDPYSRVPGTAGDVVAYDRFGGAARIPEF